jgi:NAD(P)-dependent dehydrogenase (short-subunit alcohol dehydrogenase family)
VVCEVVARLCAQEGQVQPAAGERVGQIRRVVAGDRDLNVLQFVVYAGSKDAVEGITKSVALETAKSGIRVNAVAPGPAYTDMLTRFTGTPANKASLQAEVPMGRLARTEELPTRSSSSHPARHPTSPATSSTSTAVTPSADPAPAASAARFQPGVRAGGIRFARAPGGARR